MAGLMRYLTVGLLSKWRLLPQACRQRQLIPGGHRQLVCARPERSRLGERRTCVHRLVTTGVIGSVCALLLTGCGSSGSQTKSATPNPKTSSASQTLNCTLITVKRPPMYKGRSISQALAHLRVGAQRKYGPGLYRVQFFQNARHGGKSAQIWLLYRKGTEPVGAVLAYDVGAVTSVASVNRRCKSPAAAR